MGMRGHTSASAGCVRARAGTGEAAELGRARPSGAECGRAKCVRVRASACEIVQMRAGACEVRARSCGRVRTIVRARYVRVRARCVGNRAAKGGRGRPRAAEGAAKCGRMRPDAAELGRAGLWGWRAGACEGAIEGRPSARGLRPEACGARAGLGRGACGIGRMRARGVRDRE